MWMARLCLYSSTRKVEVKRLSPLYYGKASQCVSCMHSVTRSCSVSLESVMKFLRG